MVDIIDGAFSLGYRYITTYLKNTDLIRVTGYLVKKAKLKNIAKAKLHYVIQPGMARVRMNVPTCLIANYAMKKMSLLKNN